MDRSFLQYWGNVLLNAAVSHEQMQGMEEWLRKENKGIDMLRSIFINAYGLDQCLDSSGRPEAKAWKDAEEKFQKSLREYLALFSVVTFDEYNDLFKKNKELNENIASLEGKIRDLQMRLGGM